MNVPSNGNGGAMQSPASLAVMNSGGKKAGAVADEGDELQQQSQAMLKREAIKDRIQAQVQGLDDEVATKTNAAEKAGGEGEGAEDESQGMQQTSYGLGIVSPAEQQQQKTGERRSRTATAGSVDLQELAAAAAAATGGAANGIIGNGAGGQSSPIGVDAPFAHHRLPSWTRKTNISPLVPVHAQQAQAQAQARAAAAVAAGSEFGMLHPSVSLPNTAMHSPVHLSPAVEHSGFIRPNGSPVVSPSNAAAAAAAAPVPVGSVRQGSMRPNLTRAMTEDATMALLSSSSAASSSAIAAASPPLIPQRTDSRHANGSGSRRARAAIPSAASVFAAGANSSVDSGSLSGSVVEFEDLDPALVAAAGVARSSRSWSQGSSMRSPVRSRQVSAAGSMHMPNGIIGNDAAAGKGRTDRESQPPPPNVAAAASSASPDTTAPMARGSSLHRRDRTEASIASSFGSQSFSSGSALDYLRARSDSDLRVDGTTVPEVDSGVEGAQGGQQHHHHGVEDEEESVRRELEKARFAPHRAVDVAQKGTASVVQVEGKSIEAIAGAISEATGEFSWSEEEARYKVADMSSPSRSDHASPNRFDQRRSAAGLLGNHAALACVFSAVSVCTWVVTGARC